MSVATVMMVRDEEDIVGPTIRHLLTQVDHVYVADNMSTDGTPDIVRDFGEDSVSVTTDREVAYEQSQKTTKLARWATSVGHGWIVPCDADEVWLAPDGYTVGQWLEAQAYDVQIVSALLYDHIPTSNDDPSDPVPQTRINWRKKTPSVFPKVACRYARTLTIQPGNHGADYDRTRVLQVPGLELHHFTWRTPEQYLRKIRNGLEAYADVKRLDIGVHWRMYEGATDEEIMDHFRTWFFVDDPDDHPDLTYDPLVLDVDGRFTT